MKLFAPASPVVRLLTRMIPAIAVMSMVLSAPLGAEEVKSPDGAIAVKLVLESGKLSYGVTYKNKPMLESSPLGLETSIGSFSTGLKSGSVATATIDERYTLPHGKVRDVHYIANELTVRFLNEKNDSLAVIVRVSDRDVAFSYRVSSRNKYRIVVERELTGFKLPSTATATITPQAPWGGGFAATKPSYEEAYLLDAPVGTKSQYGLGFTFPALFHLGNDGWMLISETGLSSKYVGSRLGEPTPEGLYPLAFAEKTENAGIGDATAAASLPMNTPWRTITVGSTLAPIVESTVATDVVKPLYEASQVYKQGRATWSWILWQDASMNEADQRAYIDLAATMGYEYILIDALWDKNIGRTKMAELVAYARSKKVDVILWYNTNGYSNDAPQSPRDCLDTAPARHNEMAWLKSIGVKGMKVDFFGGDKQVTIKYYEDVLTDANIYGLMLNFHGATIPRGWERMYPNFMTSESVTSSENLIFTQGFADKEAQNSTIFSFVRNSVAAMDFGPVLLNKVLSRDQKRGTQRRTTDAFQLATAVLYQSPIQHIAIAPNNLSEQPAYVIDFLRKVPAAWDEVRYIDGYPGSHAVYARRSGNRWYIAATNGGKEAKNLTVTLPFLAGKSVDLYYDKEDRMAGTRKVTVGADGKVPLSLAIGGGAVVVYTP